MIDAAAGHKKLKDKSLYLCFGEYKVGGKVVYAIQSINLSRLLSKVITQAAPEKSYLRQVEVWYGDDLPVHMGFGVFGSEIVLAGGYKAKHNVEEHEFVPDLCKEVYVCETDPSVNPNARIKPSRNLVQGKAQPLLWELEGKLYALAGFPCGSNHDMSYFHSSPCFEVLDPTVGTWSPLPDPPSYYCEPPPSPPTLPPLSFCPSESPTPLTCVYGSDDSFLSPDSSDGIKTPPYKNPSYFHYRDFSYAVVGTNIFVSHPNGTYRFDVTHPDQQWIEEFRHCRNLDADEDADVGDSQFLKFEGTSLTLDVGDGNFLVFSYKGFGDWDTVNDSDDEDYRDKSLSVSLISPGISMRQSQPLFPEDGVLIPSYFYSPSGYTFVHLGGRKVCLLICGVDGDYNDIEKISVCAITFKFKLIKDAANFRVKTKFLPIRFMEYSTPPYIGTVQMHGAFLLTNAALENTCVSSNKRRKEEKMKKVTGNKSREEKN